MTIDILKALRTIDRNFLVEEVVANNGERRIVAHAGDEQGVRIIQELASLYRFKIHPTEVASSGSIVLVEKAADEDFDQDDDSDDTFEYDIDDDDDDDDEDDDSLENDRERPSDLNVGDGSLRYLNTSEGHKFAQRIYTNMLGNQDMARYAQFLIDLDKFFGSYVNKDAADFGARKKRIESAAAEIADDLNIDEEAIIEEAKKKKKKGRAGLLSALMKAISGDAGDALVSAWDNGDAAKLKELLDKAIESVASKVDTKDSEQEEAIEVEEKDVESSPGGKAQPAHG